MLTCAAAAVQCLERKKLYEQQIEQLGNFQLQIHDYSTWYYFLIKKVISATSTKVQNTYNSILIILTFCKNVVK